MNKIYSAAVAFIFVKAALVIALFIGWVMNIVTLFGVDLSGPVSGTTVLRLIGIPVFVIGGVMGWL